MLRKKVDRSQQRKETKVGYRVKTRMVGMKGCEVVRREPRMCERKEIGKDGRKERRKGWVNE